MSLDDDARGELMALEAAHRRRTARVLEGRQGTRVVIDGAHVTSFASNDYLGLASDVRLARAAAEASERDGTGAGASRLIVGNHAAHVALERSIAEWMRCEAGGVRLFNSGYAANTGVLTALLREGDVVFSDELNHASIVDGCRLSRASIEIYRHLDVADLERKLSRRTGRRRIVVTESVFSMDGDVADLAAISAIVKRADAAWIVDEAHALGVRGEEGRGVAAAARVRPDVVIGTFGKALGSFGAFAATTSTIAELLWNRARPFVFSTGLPPGVVAASGAAIEIVRGVEGSERRARVAASARRLRELLGETRRAYRDSSTAIVEQRERADASSTEIPIVPVIIGDDRRVAEIGEGLLREGMLVASVRPPTVPEGTARLRISVSADHSMDEVDRVAASIQRAIGGGFDSNR